METRLKISATQKGKPQTWLYRVKNPEGKVMYDFDNGKSLVCISEELGFKFKTFIKNTIYKSKKNYKGWTVDRIKTSKSINSFK